MKFILKFIFFSNFKPDWKSIYLLIRRVKHAVTEIIKKCFIFE